MSVSVLLKYQKLIEEKTYNAWLAALDSLYGYIINSYAIALKSSTERERFSVAWTALNVSLK